MSIMAAIIFIVLIWPVCLQYFVKDKVTWEERKNNFEFLMDLETATTYKWQCAGMIVVEEAT
jgi:hypothetical protein